MWSRLMYATRISLTIGLVGVALSLVLGVVLGGISGFFGGIDRHGRSSASSRSCARSRRSRSGWAWPPPCRRTGASLQVYFAITIIISLIGWTELARVVRGRFLSLREEDFVMAAELVGCSQIADHLPPHGAVVPEPHHRRDHAGAAGDDHQRDVAVSFLGLGLRPPAISWGVLLQQAQNVQTRGALAVAAAPGRPGDRRRSWRSTSSATACATPPIRIDV